MSTKKQTNKKHCLTHIYCRKDVVIFTSTKSEGDKTTKMRLLVLSLLLPLARAVDLPTLVTCLQQAEAQSTIAVEWGAGNCNLEGGAALQGVVMDAVCAVTLHKQIAGEQ